MSVVSAELVKKLRDQTQAGMMACKKALEETQGNFEDAVDLLRKKGEIKAANCATKTAAEGRVEVAIAADNKRAVMAEVNCQTDFTGREANFVAFTQDLARAALQAGAKTVSAALALKPSNQYADFESWRKELVTKIGENIQLRRLVELESQAVIGQYCHGNRIGVLVSLDGGNEELARDIAMHVAASRPIAVSGDQVSPALIEKEKEIFSAQARESGKPDAIIEKMIAGRVSKFLKEVSLLDQPFVKNPEQTISQLLQAHKAKVIAFERFELGEGIEKEVTDFAAEVMAQIKQ